MKPKFKNELSIGTRIKECREELQLSRNFVCKKLDNLALSTLQKWEMNEREPSAGMIVRLAKILQTTPTYLLTGEDKTGALANIVQGERYYVDSDNVSLIESYSYIRVSAGFGSFNDGIVDNADGEEPYSDRLINQLGVKPNQCAVFWAHGNSMLPTIASGDQLLVDLSKTEILGDDKIYLVQNNESVWVKRVRVDWDGIELRSDNKEEYAPIRISAQDAENLKILGQVVHVGHKLI